MKREHDNINELKDAPMADFNIKIDFSAYPAQYLSKQRFKRIMPGIKMLWTLRHLVETVGFKRAMEKQFEEQSRYTKETGSVTD